MNTPVFYGSIVALVTPMNSDGSIAEQSFRQLIDWHIQSGTQTISVIGTTGEAPTIRPYERARIIDLVMTHVAGRVPVMIGTGSNDTQTAIEYTQQAAAAGAQGALVITPYCNKPTQRGLIEHYSVIAESCDIPIVLYNVPGRTACDLLPETVATLAKIPHVIGIKEATGDLSRLDQLRACCPKDFLFFSGDDITCADFMLRGGKGVISVTANIAPKEMAMLCLAAMAGEDRQAQALQMRLMPLHRALFVESNPIPVKWAVHQTGLIPDGIRLPLTWLSPEQQPVVKSALSSLNLSYVAA